MQLRQAELPDAAGVGGEDGCLLLWYGMTHFFGEWVLLCESRDTLRRAERLENTLWSLEVTRDESASWLCCCGLCCGGENIPESELLCWIALCQLDPD